MCLEKPGAIGAPAEERVAMAGAECPAQSPFLAAFEAQCQLVGFGFIFKQVFFFFP